MSRALVEHFIFLLFTLISISTTHPHFLLADALPTLRGNGSDYEALLAIKAQISDDPDSVLSSWGNNSLHFCQWRGIACGQRHKCVVSLSLPSANLGGTLSPFIGNLSFLRMLNLSDNSFRGEIPHQISHLPRLRELWLLENSFGGKIPANLSHCLHLTTLVISINKLEGRIPTEVATLPNLVLLGLHDNHFSGYVKDIGIGNMSNSLQILHLRSNHLQGSIPDDIGGLQSLIGFVLGDNNISDIIPPSLFNLSTIEWIYLTNTEIHGYLPQDLSLHFPQLHFLEISNTYLTGQVPPLSNLSMLKILDISQNSFTGRLSLNGNNLPYLRNLDLEETFAKGAKLRNLKFLDTLTNCTNLLSIMLGGNSFIGSLPPSILNFSNSLQIIRIPNNYIFGQLPFGLSKYVNLTTLIIYNNNFTSPIPADIGTLGSMGILDLSYNNFSKETPSSLGNLTLLNYLYLGYNNLEGLFPKSLGNCPFLQIIDFPANKLSGVVPVELFDASNLLYLAIGHNNLQGSLPAEISRLKNLEWLDVSDNGFSGEIPSVLGGSSGLTFLNMSGNSFVGSIPKSLSHLKSIETLDLSYNNLSGQIPSYFSNWSYLSILNLSFNNFEGKVPISGVFSNTSVVSVAGNGKLCGGVPTLHLPSCPLERESKKRRLSLRVVVIISITSSLTVALAVALCFYWVCSSKKKKNTSLESQEKKSFIEVSYQMLSSATDGFSPTNLLGVGGFGSVYKGLLRQDEKEVEAAVKVLNLQNKGADKIFTAECNALREIRHRNLCKIITVCSSIDTQRNYFKALVYEFMPRGSLESWIHSSNLASNENVDGSLSCSLTIFQRVSIAIDVASALEYLHIGCAIPIIHCDLKPNNILLDDEMTAHVGDFGLAKILSEAPVSNTTSETSSTQVRGTVGYVAPEYGLGRKVSFEGDVYCNTPLL